jgi:hypothetical protein
VGCRSPKCHGELDQDDLYRLQQLDKEGKYPCPEHLSPAIQVSADGVVLNGRHIVRADDMPPAGPLKRIRPLFTELKMARETWKQIHPGEMFDPLPSLEIASDLEASVAASAIASTVFAGYPHLHLKTGGVFVDLYYAVPGPPRADNDVDNSVLIERMMDGSQRVSFRRGNVPFESTPGPIPFEQVPVWVSESCKKSSGPCPATVVLRPSGPFVVTATLLRNLIDRQALGPRLIQMRFADDGY